MNWGGGSTPQPTDNSHPGLTKSMSIAVCLPANTHLLYPKLKKLKPDKFFMGKPSQNWAGQGSTQATVLYYTALMVGPYTTVQWSNYRTIYEGAGEYGER